MGTAQTIEFAAAKIEKKPEELAAEVLKSLRADVKEHLGFVPARAVISVPALFELPQSAATSEAARLAGFERVELIQEPVASALAAGWTRRGRRSGSWLVYDLGGGTFDVSLLETRDGLLRVVGHDGDNFLGGRDFDWALVDWVLAELGRTQGAIVSRADPKHAAAVRKLKLAVEEAKIELTRAEEASLVAARRLRGRRRAPSTSTCSSRGHAGGALGAARRSLDRGLSGACSPRTGSRRRQLGAHRARRRAHGDARAARAASRDALGVRFGEGLDPMTLVAQGAAIYAATAGLDARPPRPPEEHGRGASWLQYPAMSSDLTPHVVGRLVDAGRRRGHSRSALSRDDGAVDEPRGRRRRRGRVRASRSTSSPRRPNVFASTPRTDDGAPGRGLAVDVHDRAGHDDQRSAALAHGRRRARERRGARLLRARRAAARAAHLRATTRSRASRKGSASCLLKIPIVQGELRAGAPLPARRLARDRRRRGEGEPARGLARSRSRSSSIAAATSRRARSCRRSARSSSTSPTCSCPTRRPSRSIETPRACASGSRSSAPTRSGATPQRAHRQADVRRGARSPRSRPTSRRRAAATPTRRRRRGARCSRSTACSRRPTPTSAGPSSTRRRARRSPAPRACSIAKYGTPRRAAALRRGGAGRREGARRAAAASSSSASSASCGTSRAPRSTATRAPGSGSSRRAASRGRSGDRHRQGARARARRQRGRSRAATWRRSEAHRRGPLEALPVSAPEQDGSGYDSGVR